MKQKLLKTMLLLSALVVGNSNVRADNETYSAAAGPSFTGGTHFTLTADKNSGSAPAYNSTEKGVRLYAGSYLSIAPNNGETITAVTLSVKCNTGGKNNVYPTGVSANTGTITAGATPGESVTSISWEGSTASTLTFTVAGSAGNVSVKTVAITYSGGGGTTPSNLALTGDPITLNFDLYNNKSAQEIAYTTSGTGAVSVVSNDYVDATVNTATKKISITPKKVTGSAQTITVNQAADATYAAGSVTFKVNITDSTPIQTFEKITSADDLATGDELMIVYDGSNGQYAATTVSSQLLGYTEVEISGSSTISYKNSDDANVFVLGGKAGAWTLYSKKDDAYVYATAAKKLAAGSADDAAWTISYSSGDLTLSSTTASYGTLQFNYNNGNPRFLNYTSTQEAIQLYRKVVDRTALSVGPAGYTTYTTKKNVSFPVGVSAYIVSAVGADNVTLTEVLAAPVNTPLVIEAAEGNYDLSEEALVDCDDVSSNELIASNGFVAGNVSNIYALGDGPQSIGFYLVGDGVKVPTGKAYLIGPAVGGGPVKEFFGFGFGEDADGIQTLSDSPLKGENIYNLAGQRLQKMQKGINIVNGKKVLY